MSLAQIKGLGIAYLRKDNKIMNDKGEYSTFSLEEMHEKFREKVSELVCDSKGNVDYYKWQRNSLDIYELLATMLDEVEPRKVKDTFGRFAEIKTYQDGQKPRFTTRQGKRNVRRFLTKVSAAGVYERVRLDRDYFDVDVYAHGGAVYQTLEGFLTGRENIDEVFNILLEAYEDELFNDIITALKGIYDVLPANNKASVAGFNPAEMKKILATVSAYGTPEILCTLEFASTITQDASFIGDADKTDIRNQGYLGKWNGANVVLMPQSFTDPTNTVKVIDPQYAYIMPSGSSELPIKVALEGGMKVRQPEREDWSVEIQSYRKAGVGILHTNYMGIYRNTSL